MQCLLRLFVKPNFRSNRTKQTWYHRRAFKATIPRSVNYSRLLVSTEPNRRDVPFRFVVSRLLHSFMFSFICRSRGDRLAIAHRRKYSAIAKRRVSHETPVWDRGIESWEHACRGDTIWFRNERILYDIAFSNGRPCVGQLPSEHHLSIDTSLFRGLWTENYEGSSINLDILGFNSFGTKWKITVFERNALFQLICYYCLELEEVCSWAWDSNKSCI